MQAIPNSTRTSTSSLTLSQIPRCPNPRMMEREIHVPTVKFHQISLCFVESQRNEQDNLYFFCEIRGQAGWLKNEPPPRSLVIKNPLNSVGRGLRGEHGLGPAHRCVKESSEMPTSDGSFSAVWTATIASKDAFCSVFQNQYNYVAEPVKLSGPLHQFLNVRQTLAGSFSAVWTATMLIAIKHAFFRMF